MPLGCDAKTLWMDRDGEKMLDKKRMTLIVWNRTCSNQNSMWCTLRLATFLIDLP